MWEMMLGPVMQAGASIWNNERSLGAQREANQMNRQTALDQMAFQERMSSSAYQRSVEDMKRAGLNPILAAGGGGASSPSGASATANPEVGDPHMLEGAIASAQDALQMKKDFEAKDAQIEATKASTAVAKKEEEIKATTAKALQAQLPATQAQAKADQKAATYDERAAGFDAVVKRATGVLGSALDVVNLRRLIGAPSEREKYDNRRLERAGPRGIPTR